MSQRVQQSHINETGWSSLLGLDDQRDVIRGEMGSRVVEAGLWW